MARPTIYGLGSVPEIMMATHDDNGTVVVPTEARLTIQDPHGSQITVSGGQMTVDGDYLIYLYQGITTSGFYQYEGWVKSASGKEDARTNGFQVIDRIID